MIWLKLDIKSVLYFIDHGLISPITILCSILHIYSFKNEINNSKTPIVLIFLVARINVMIQISNILKCELYLESSSTS